MEYFVVFEKAKDGSIWARVPDLPGCFSYGDNINEARKNIKEAIEVHIEAMKAEGIPVPSANHLKIELVEVDN